jgi:hypothetical protein
VALVTLVERAVALGAPPAEAAFITDRSPALQVNMG